MGAFVIFVFGIAAAATVCPSLKNGRLLRSLRSSETPGLNSHLFFPVRRGCRHRGRIGPDTNDSPLYAEGLHLVLLFVSWLIMSAQSDLIAECTTVAQGGNVDFRWGIWNDDSGDHLTAQEAANCSSVF
jgi:hypothetical protein